MYGWSAPASCDNYQWGGVLDTSLPNSYQSEHVLEWSVVTNFFTTMNSEFAADEFTSADPVDKGKKISFCKYWKQTWELKGEQVMPNPAPNAGMSPAKTQRTPANWLAAAFPYSEVDEGGPMFLDELPLLYTPINSPAKNNVSDLNIDNHICTPANIPVHRCFQVTPFTRTKRCNNSYREQDQRRRYKMRRASQSNT